MKHFFSTTLVNNSNSGYTMIEVLIALSIFSIGLMAMGALRSASLMSTGNAGRRTEALAILEDQTESLKSLPFYLTIAGIDKDGNGAIDGATTIPADLVAGNHTEARLGGRYNVTWQVVDNQPIPQQNQTVIPGVPVGVYTVSKTVSVQVIRPGDNPLTEAMANAQFVKTWAADGIP